MSEAADRLNAALEGRYRIERELGEGGMATVYLADDLRHERKVALKVLRPELAAVVGAERFLAEIKTTANLQHPHILPLHDSGEADGLLFFVMPYVEGETLREKIAREGPLTREDAVRILRDVADGLAYAHARGLVHRDIKPANILLSGRHATISDFGVAKAVSGLASQADYTATGIVVGTPMYMAPEQASGDTTVDQAVDIYAFGVMAYEALNGDAPYRGSTPQQIISRQLTENPTPIGELRPDVPGAIAGLVMRCLEKESANNRPSANHLVDELERLAASTGQRPATPAASPMPRVVITFALGLIIGTGLLAYVVYGGPSVVSEGEVLAAISEIERLTAASDFTEAYDLVTRLDERIRDDSLREELWARVARPVALESSPTGALVLRRDYAPAGAEWEELGRTPLQIERFPLGQSRVRFELDGYASREVATSAAEIASVGAVRLSPRGTLPEGMAPVIARLPFSGADAYGLFAPGLEQVPNLALGEFLMAESEVTNGEYANFVEAGGYADPTCWEHAFLEDDDTLSFYEAVDGFTDRTGRPGPATWDAGTFPTGEADFPVGGVSWYEAAAYACFEGMALPTVYHWYAAANPFSSPHVVPLSNYGDGPAPVTEFEGVSRDGIYDLAGNVREWTRNAHGQSRFILGGGWADLEYSFNDAVTAPAFDRSPLNGIRLVQYSDTTNLEAASAPLYLAFRDYRAEQPVSDEVFEAYRQMYAYDDTPLNDRVVAADTTDLWIREQVDLDAAYGGERLTVFVFTPRGGVAPYQGIIYFPGSGAIYRRSYDELELGRVEFLLRSGRAVVFPVYKGTFERGTDLRSDIQNESNGYREHVIAWGKDLRRSVDYVGMRADIDADRLGYLGISWGGAVAPIMLAVEDRIRAAVIVVGGLLMQDVQPMADPFHFLPRVRQPTVMINARWDSFYPLETAQRPFFENLGTPEEDRKLVIIDANHGVFSYAPNVVVGETLEWLDRYLGPIR